METLDLDIQGGGNTPKSMHVVLVNWAEDSEGRIFISPDCRLASEVDVYLDGLIEDIERIRVEARRHCFSALSRRKTVKD